MTVRRNPEARSNSTYPLQVVTGLAGTSRAKVKNLRGGKKGKNNLKGYRYNAQSVNNIAQESGSRAAIRRAALARWAKLTQANRPARPQRERDSR